MIAEVAAAEVPCKDFCMLKIVGRRLVLVPCTLDAVADADCKSQRLGTHVGPSVGSEQDLRKVV